ncbi:alpha/beta hydrolase [Pseudarthrobacter sp. NPDC080039]|uniref:alpha/beta fold hydrolase n=1 Tax=unclassified Pseudarthrobacter TaxID=2647000 RepID=UPI00344E8EE0
MKLTPEEARFDEAQEDLFQDLNLSVESRFLYPDDPGRRIHVLETGEGDPVVMIHGGNSVAAGWAPLLIELDGRFHVYAADRPGCGLTHPQDYRKLNLREHAIQFLDDVLDGLELDHATLVGNSMGGYWSLLYAINRPERVERVILIGEPAGSTKRLGLKIRAIGTPVINRLLLATLGRARPNPDFLHGLVVDTGKLTPKLMNCFYAGALIPGAGHAWRTMLELIAAPGKRADLTYALIPLLPTIKCPVLFCWGDHDMTPPTAGIELTRHLNQARFEGIQDAGLITWIDKPKEVARLFKDFMSSP